MTEMPSRLPPRTFTDRVIRFCLEQKLVVALIVLLVVAWGVMVAPFDWKISGLHRKPVPTDAIPDIGENQQIVYSEWPGRSPKDVDDQVTYPLTTSLLGIPGVKTIRSSSMFGFSMVLIIFEENVPFESAQNRVIARLNGLPAGTLPEGVTPALGPYATALGQIFWYTLEGRDPDGRPIGGWDLNELRTWQDFFMRYHLQAAGGITEVAPIGGFVQEYQIDVDPDALRAFNVTIADVSNAVRMSNLDVGARQIEVNRVEYLVRARGFIRRIKDIEDTVVAERENVPVYVKNVAHVSLGPALREGALDKEGAEAVGGIVVVRQGYNPLEAIDNVKRKIAEIRPSMPARAVVDYTRTTAAALDAFAEAHDFQSRKQGVLDQDAWSTWLRTHPREQWPAGVTTSTLTVVPYYDRTKLIHETLGTLNDALYEQVLITTIVVIVMAANLPVGMLISAVMPLAVGFSFIAMKLLGVDANIVSLSGIAIAIGTIVDMGIILCQNILQHLEDARPDESRLEVIYRASSEVGSAVVTAISTTIVGFMPVFFMTGPEGRLFRPLAFTKTFCLVGSVIAGLTVIPAAAHLLIAGGVESKNLRRVLGAGTLVAGVVLGARFGFWLLGAILIALGAWFIIKAWVPKTVHIIVRWTSNVVAVIIVGVLLTKHWMPLGIGEGFGRNLVIVAVLIGGFLIFYYLVQITYVPVLRFFLRFKAVFLVMPVAVTLVGYTAWLGFNWVFTKGAGEERAAKVRQTRFYVYLNHKFPGFGREFMPPLDEGSYLYMPITMPHASIGEALDVVARQDMAIRAIPEVESVVGKIGRASSALDPAPVNMIETVVNYKSEYASDAEGRPVLYRYNEARGYFERDASGNLVEDPRGRPYRQWRESIRSPDDIWKEIVAAAQMPGATGAPKLQPIAARLVMLQSGMRAPMGVKVYGPDLDSIESVGIQIEKYLRQVALGAPSSVTADRIVGKPYLEIDLDRQALARYGMRVADVQEVIEIALGGVRLTTTVEGLRRFPVRVRYARELRDRIDSMERILIPAMDGTQIPLTQVANIEYVRGPEEVKSENTQLVSYVLFDRKPEYAEVDTVESCRDYLALKRKSGEFVLPAGVTYEFTGNYINQINATRTLTWVVPLTLFVIFIIIYFQFRSVVTTSLVFTTIFVCWGGGLLYIWCYGQPGFLDFSVFGVNFHDLFHVHQINMSVAIWVGFLALFGIASDDAVVICTYLEQRFHDVKPGSIDAIREATVYAGKRRIKACLMTTATTVLALLPVLTSTGRGSDIMVPMSLPGFGGMVIEVVTMFLAPVLYCLMMEWKWRMRWRDPRLTVGR